MEQGKPQLDLNVSGGMKSREDDYTDSYDLDTPRFTALINFSYPLGTPGPPIDQCLYFKVYGVDIRPDLIEIPVVCHISRCVFQSPA